MAEITESHLLYPYAEQGSGGSRLTARPGRIVSAIAGTLASIVALTGCSTGNTVGAEATSEQAHTTSYSDRGFTPSKPIPAEPGFETMEESASTYQKNTSFILNVGSYVTYLVDYPEQADDIPTDGIATDPHALLITQLRDYADGVRSKYAGRTIIVNACPSAYEDWDPAAWACWDPNAKKDHPSLLLDDPTEWPNLTSDITMEVVTADTTSVGSEEREYTTINLGTGYQLMQGSDDIIRYAPTD